MVRLVQNTMIRGMEEKLKSTFSSIPNGLVFSMFGYLLAHKLLKSVTERRRFFMPFSTCPF